MIRHQTLHFGIVMLSCFCFSFTTAQQLKPFTQLTTTNPTADLSDLEQLAPYFEGVKVVGMGESTHGTHEFFTMRHRVFRYLVERHGFNTFFMEADYANCLRLNRFIHGAEDDVKEAVIELGLWPWQTFEVVDIVNWMRSYNQKHPNQAINFVGADMQFGYRTWQELNNILTKNNVPVPETSLPMPEVKWRGFLIEKTKDVAPIEELYHQFIPIDTSPFSVEDQHNYSWLLRHFKQWIDSQKDKKSNYFRDICMGENIVKHLSEDPAIKGFFWAHNGHVNAQVFRKYGSKRWIGVAGGCLKHYIGDQYFSLGQEFFEGEFNSYFPAKENGVELEGEKYTLGPVKVKPSPEGSFAANHSNLETPVFIDFSFLPKSEKVAINSIGALYYPKLELKKKHSVFYRANPHGQDSFDAIILITKSTHTRILKTYK